MTLPERFHTYLAKVTQDGKYVTKEHLTKLATSKGYSPTDILEALGAVHRMKDIQVRVKDDSTIYRLRQLPKPKMLQTRIKQTPEQRAELQDFIDNSPLLSDEEREAMRTPFRDRTDRQHQLTDTSAGYRHTMEGKYGVMVWKRMCEDSILK